ncbi:hypothetical protein [Metallosphaera javensis (ex Hofmann et al. 2022)]|uniref:hypothetical protein n=1 Tax=Metallosphaera javensis (ex Hofmann et al. 2022) TaxID=99938 RepID=UPI001EDE8849|nr:hypothetical protein [Metallosphaera javensis (ex Hofmann et al. 2022)]
MMQRIVQFVDATSREDRAVLSPRHNNINTLLMLYKVHSNGWVTNLSNSNPINKTFRIHSNFPQLLRTGSLVLNAVL